MRTTHTHSSQASAYEHRKFGAKNRVRLVTKQSHAFGDIVGNDPSAATPMSTLQESLEQSVLMAEDERCVHLISLARGPVWYLRSCIDAHRICRIAHVISGSMPSTSIHPMPTCMPTQYPHLHIHQSPPYFRMFGIRQLLCCTIANGDRSCGYRRR